MKYVPIFTLLYMLASLSTISGCGQYEKDCTDDPIGA